MNIILFFLYIVLTILLLSTLIILIWLTADFIMHLTLRYETFPSQANVCRKKYRPSYTTTTLSKVGKITVPQIHHHSAEYNVYLMYNGEEYCINDKNLYNSVKIGNMVRVFVNKGYNKRHQLKDVYLSLE